MSKKDSYDASDIEVLEGLEPVRKRPGMYIGGTDKNGMHHLFSEIIEYDGPNYSAIKEKFIINSDNQFIANLYPEKRLYFSNDMPMTEAGIEPGLTRDLYVTLGNLISDDRWSVRIYHKPLVRLIWLGALMMVLGGILSVIIRKKHKKLSTQV